MEICRDRQKTKILPSYCQRQAVTHREPNRMAHLFKVYEQAGYQYLSILGITPNSSAALHRVKEAPAVLERSKTDQMRKGSAKNSNIFKYFQTFHTIFRIFSNVSRYFSNVFKRFRTFLFCLSCPISTF